LKNIIIGCLLLALGAVGYACWLIESREPRTLTDEQGWSVRLAATMPDATVYVLVDRDNSVEYIVVVTNDGKGTAIHKRTKGD